jgi:hypothetical protein
MAVPGPDLGISAATNDFVYTWESGGRPGQTSLACPLARKATESEIIIDAPGQPAGEDRPD